MFSQDCCGRSLAPVNIVGSPGQSAGAGANGANGALVLLGQAAVANFKVPGSTQEILITGFPANYIILHIIVTAASASLAGAVGGIYTDAAKSGTILVPALQAYGAVTGPGTWLSLPVANPCSVGGQTSGAVRTEAALHLYLDVVSAGLATANVNVYGYAL